MGQTEQLSERSLCFQWESQQEKGYKSLPQKQVDQQGAWGILHIIYLTDIQIGKSKTLRSTTMKYAILFCLTLNFLLLIFLE